MDGGRLFCWRSLNGALIEAIATASSLDLSHTDLSSGTEDEVDAQVTTSGIHSSKFHLELNIRNYVVELRQRFIKKDLTTKAQLLS